MSRRDHIIQLVGSILAAAVAAVLARYGIVIPALPAAPPVAEVRPDQPPTAMPQVTPVPAADAMGSRVKLRFAGGGCTGAVTGPQRSDGRYLVTTASHCCQHVGETAAGTMPDGTTLTLVVQSIDRRSDCAWMLTQPVQHPLPYINLATKAPAVGRKVWVAGYGVHAPGVQRFGAVAGPVGPDGKVRYRIAVSPGDSGGPIVDDETGELLGVVCCTAAFGRDADVFAAGPSALLAAKPQNVSAEPEWVPFPMPSP